MAGTEKVVYLEDLEVTKTSEAVKGEASEAPSSAQPASTDAKAPAGAEPKSTGTGLKRQRTLLDMFSRPADPASAPAAKKIRTDASSSGLQPLNSVPFSQSEFVDSLTDEEKELLALELETMGKSWLKILKDEIRKPYFLQLKRFLLEQGVRGAADSAKVLKVYPAPKNIYSWSNLTPLGRVKVVIIGQDPYHGAGQAHGLSFSVPPGVGIPPSLRNIYAEIKAEYPGFAPPAHGNLAAWAERGVLLLNTCLTVRAGDAGSHSGKGWEQFTDKVVDAVDRYGGASVAGGGRGRGIVFLAWGAWAAKRVAKLDKKKHLILTSAHPSPFSAHKGFLGNGHFKKANDWLVARYGPAGAVDWCAL
ncbi:hypothetical protein CERSUDRAFT_86888 [Gelatoporia subvermispora B]|uniref:Uracil-DNA glycosylase n=1 Tax=Ceriporiopsis subvermispora (strain B) TaxID=914234 RepID=M2R6Y9_CERS8|nr:hypothetical protein CERSUDRAFT_86888 [Gelatoporia subvermispora B]